MINWMDIVTNILKYFKGYIYKTPIYWFEVYYVPKKNNETIHILNQNIKNFYNPNPNEENFDIEYNIKNIHLDTIGEKRIFNYEILSSGNVNNNILKHIYGDIYYSSMKYISKKYSELYETGHIFDYFDEVIKIRYGQNIEYYKYNKFQRIIQDIPSEYYIDLEYSNDKLQIKSYENIKYFQDWQKQDDWYKEIIIGNIPPFKTTRG